MARFDHPRRRPRRHRGSGPQPCLCPVCIRSQALWRESIAQARAEGLTLWQFTLGGPALAESMVIITDDPERCAAAIDAETLAVPKQWPERPMTIVVTQLPPVGAWRDADQLANVQALPRNVPLTAAQLRAHGVRLREFVVLP
jgi:hypothetical protein